MNGNGGRTATKLAAILREQIRLGAFAPGAFLPALRRVAAEHGVAYMTAVRAMKLLEDEGLIVAEPRQGYRVMSRAVEPSRGAPVAVVAGGDTEDPEHWSPTHRGLLMGFQMAAAKHGWSTLAAVVGNRKSADVVEQMQASGVVGVALDATSPEVIRGLKGVGIPVVLIDAWTADGEADAAVQDNMHGSYIAARHLIEQGCKRIGWVGTDPTSIHAMERYGGAASALAAEGLSFVSQQRAETDQLRDFAGAAEALFSSSDHPDGVIAMWQGAAQAVRDVAHKRGLTIGKDFKMVGWSIEENYESLYRPMFYDGHVPPAVTWSVRTMAEVALKRLLERRSCPDMSPVRINVPTKLRLRK